MTAEGAINFFHSPRVITNLAEWQDGNILQDESACSKGQRNFNSNNPQDYPLLRFSSMKRHHPSR
jgi:hypothetical protein